MPQGLKTILRTLGVIFDGLQFAYYAIRLGCYVATFVFSIFGL